jgi:competence protein ComEC
MGNLKIGYFITAITTGLVLLFSFLQSLPDGTLHMYACSVGQGDGMYVRLPDGKDMVIDGGPNESIINCLGKYMPFWDRHIDMVIMTHPQKDHLQGLIAVMDRYRVDYFIRSRVDNPTEGYKTLLSKVARNKTHTKFMVAGDRVTIGSIELSFLWPTQEQIAKGNGAPLATAVLGATADTNIKDEAPVGDLNDYSLVFWLRYGSFDALFTGDADTRVESGYVASALADKTVELLKVPHHGSRTGMNEAFIQWIKPAISIISVGKNTYGHPSRDAINILTSVSSQIYRTDKDGDIEVVTDGQGMQVVSHK